VELFLNGRSLGVKPAGRAERYTATFEVPYEPGALKAVGHRNGKPCAEAEVHTVAAPAGIRLAPDRATLRALPGDLCYVTVEVVDAAGRVHPTAENVLAFAVEGPGTLLAVGNSNPVSTERYAGDRRGTFRGRCLAVVKATGEPGEIRLRAESEGLAAAEVMIRVEA
jgi:beta-galactosidase